MEGIEETAVAEWADGLAGITAEQIKRGLDTWDDPWPPSLPEFRAACLGKRRNGFGLDYTPEYYRAKPGFDADPKTLLSSNERDGRRAKALASLREVRRQLTRGNTTNDNQEA